MNLNQSNKNTQTAVNRIQNSLNKLQTTINNKSTNITYKPKNLNIRKKILDDKTGDDMQITDVNIKHQVPIGYSMFNNNSMIQTDKRTNKKPYEQNDLDNNINASDNIPRTLQNRNIKYNKPTPNNNYNPNIKWKCLNCGNINLLYNNFCINCGSAKKGKIKNLLNSINFSGENSTNNFNNFVNSNNSHEKFNTELNINNSNIISNSNISSNSRAEYNRPTNQYNMNIKYSNNKTNINDIEALPKKEFNTIDNKIKGFNSWMGHVNPDKKTSTISNEYKAINLSNYLDDLNNDINNYNINYKKLNDLYLYGDYLESELKDSNDENVKLLEKYKNIKNEVHILNQKNKKIKENIEELQKKEGQLNILNEQLKNGFPMLKSKLAKELNFNDKENKENINLIKELELKNKQFFEKQKNYDNEIENLKQKINLLVKEDEKENFDEEKIKNLEEQIEQEKNEMTENNNKYILLLNKNETLSGEIDELKDKIELMKPGSDENKSEEENDEDDPIKKKEELGKQIDLYDKEITKNKKIMEDLVEEFKKIKINEKNDAGGDDPDKNEYLEFKEKNNKLTSELSKLKEMTKNLSESKDKIIEIYEDEMAKLNNFYLKAKEKTGANDDDDEDDIDEEKAEEKLMKIINENEEIKNSNFELIKDLDQLAELQKIYQVLIDENKKLKINLSQSELDEGNQKLLKDIINEENLIDEEANDDNN